MCRKGRSDSVGMQELGQNLAKVIEAAQKRPVAVCRYGRPWAYIVSQDEWLLALKDICSYLQPNHILVQTRPEVDAILSDQAEMLATLASERKLKLPTDRMVRALLLQLLYSIPNEFQLHEQLNYNLMFRWFTGLALQDQICSLELFRREVSTLLACREVPLLIKRIIGEAFSGQLLQVPAFTMNYSMMHRWLDGDISHLLDDPDLTPNAVGQ